jgi:hypothetical protein
MNAPCSSGNQKRNNKKGYFKIIVILISYPIMLVYRGFYGWSQCPRGLNHEVSSLARTLTCAFVLCVGSGLETG